MDKRTFLKNSLIGTVSIAGPCAAYPVTLLLQKEEIDKIRKEFENELKDRTSQSIIAYELCVENKEYKKYAEEIIEKEKNSKCAYLMCCDCDSDREWAEKIIEEQKNTHYASYMCFNCGSSRKWYDHIKKLDVLEVKVL